MKILSWLGRIIWTPIRRWVQSLGPYASLAVVVVPLAIVEPLKLVAAVVAGSGHWLTGTITIACAYLVSLFFVERLFVVAKPKLLTLHWFAAGWKWFVAVRGKTLALIKWPFVAASRTAARRQRTRAHRVNASPRRYAARGQTRN